MRAEQAPFADVVDNRSKYPRLEQAQDVVMYRLISACDAPEANLEGAGLPFKDDGPWPRMQGKDFPQWASVPPSGTRQQLLRMVAKRVGGAGVPPGAVLGIPVFWSLRRVPPVWDRDRGVFHAIPCLIDPPADQRWNPADFHATVAAYTELRTAAKAEQTRQRLKKAEEEKAAQASQADARDDRLAASMTKAVAGAVAQAIALVLPHSQALAAPTPAAEAQAPTRNSRKAGE